MPLLEIGAMTAVLLSYIWWWHGRFAGDFGVVLALYLGIGVASHLRAAESAAVVGVRVDNTRAALRDAMRVTWPFLAAVLLTGAAAESIAFPPAGEWPDRLVRLWVWGTLQQYGLVAFFYRRWLEALGSVTGASTGAAALFALFHLPNAFLTLVTLGAGLLACWLYRRHPNLFVLGAVHAVLSFVLLYALPEAITLRMRVGP